MIVRIFSNGPSQTPTAPLQWGTMTFFPDFLFRNQFLADFGCAPRYPICIDRYGLERVNFYLPLIRRQSEL